ncbi:MAG: DUF2070 family protein [archaeon]|nr:MAG: DUF2070 family protein [archaeon]
MPSTPSSAEQAQAKRSATEVLASRYRHLFVLPSSLALAFFGAVFTLLLSVEVAGVEAPALFAATFGVFLGSTFAISTVLRGFDRSNIGNFRRTSAVLLTGEVLWLLCATPGALYGWSIGSFHPLANALFFGALLCASVEFLVINGVFTKSTSGSLALASVHPALSLLLVDLAWPGRPEPLPAALGAVGFVIVVAFVFLLKRKRTSKGYSALGLFRSFMKTWAGGEAADLEAIIADHSEEAEVETKVMRFQTEKEGVFLVLPGVHPGPFHPIGSYDLPGVISRSFGTLGRAMTLHRPGGHERNLSTRAETEKFAAEVRRFAESVRAEADGSLRGPFNAQIGKAAVSSTAFGKDLILTISFAPLGSDDLSASVEDELERKVGGTGFGLSVVDAHNSIDHRPVSPDTAEVGWKQLFERTTEEKARAFKVAYAHSSEVGFPPAEDLTENGVALFMVEAEGRRSVFVLADANNAVPSIREEAAKALGAAGTQLIEFCTSDSHNLAARGLTVARGYKALGEATSVSSIVGLVVELAKIAGERLAPVKYGSGQFVSRVRVFGAKALEEFAEITQASSRFGRAYLRLTVSSVLLLLTLSILL